MSLIRPTRKEDTPLIHSLIRNIYATYGYSFHVEREEPHLIEPGDYFRASGGEFWVVEEDGAIVATGAVLLHRPTNQGELRTLYVDPRHRRQGEGRRLTQSAIDHARAAGCSGMFLWSDTLFVEAHRLYESLGFHRTDRRSVKIINAFDEYRYDLTFPASA